MSEHDVIEPDDAEEPKPEPTISKRRVKITRDGVLFASGLLGVAHETIISKADRPTLLILFAGMMGLPAFLNKDERDQEKKK